MSNLNEPETWQERLVGSIFMVILGGTIVVLYWSWSYHQFQKREDQKASIHEQVERFESETLRYATPADNDFAKKHDVRSK